MKEYMKPELEIISLVASEEITTGSFEEDGFGGKVGLESFNFEP